MSDRLTYMQMEFVMHLLADPDRNGTNAALKAGCKPASAYVTASKWLKMAKVRAELAKRTAKSAKKLEISADWVLERLMRLADYDCRKFYKDDGTLKQVTELDETTAFALVGMEVEKLYEHFGKGQAQNTGTVTKIKMADRGSNLERLGRYLKMFTDKVEVSGLDELAERIAKARQRSS